MIRKMYVEKRSKHALAVDRGKNAEERYSQFNDSYASKPNRSDVEEYDTRKGRSEPPREPPRKVHQPYRRPYEPSEQEKAYLMARFHTLPPMQQYKDLLTTRNVITRAEQVKKWEQNPRAFDIQGIDTQPLELMRGRLNVVWEFAKRPKIERRNTRSTSQAGSYAWDHLNKEDPGKVMINTLFGPKQQIKTEGHELGHAYDRNVLAKGKTWYIPPRKTRAIYGYHTANVNFGPLKILKGREPFDLKSRTERNLTKVEKVTREKISYYNIDTAPRRYIDYRNRKEELYANWFSGLVTMKGTVKKDTRGFYNIFRKANKPLMRALRQSDRDVTAKYIKGILG